MKRLIALFLFVITSLIFPNILWSQIQVPFRSSYKYLKGSEASGLPANWYSLEFDDTLWADGDAPFRYGDGEGGTELTDMQNNYSTLYLRKTMVFDTNSIPETIYFEANYDDGFVVWINGTEIARYNAPAILSPTAIATGQHEFGTIIKFSASAASLQLGSCIMVIAVQGFNVHLSNSSDFYFDIAVSAIPEINDSIQASFSYQSGFYYNPFNLGITLPDTSFALIYTLDGSDPRTSITDFESDTTACIYVHPDSIQGRAKTPGFTVRASLIKEGFRPSTPVTHNYIFIDKVKTQAYPGGNWPASSINGQLIDYQMSPDVVNDSRYSALIDDALLELPSLSISTDMENLFDPSTGIYVNAGNRGIEWERECHVELIYPDGQEGFQINAGLRIRGGASRGDGNPKHSLRLFFREEYGAETLDYPLFGNEGASRFYKIDLRTAQNYSWNGDGEQNRLNTFVRDIYSRDAQRGMGRPYARGRFYHLYINGMYWGLYQTQERTEAHFAETYLGDDNDDYDVVKVSPTAWPYFTEVTDGNFDAWTEVWNMCQNGFNSTEDYFRLEGKDASGNPVKGSKVLVDIDNLIDYMILVIYTGNFDAPTSSFDGNNMPNNFYAIYNRKDKGKGFIFCAHDSEHSLMTDPVYVGEGLYENRVSIADRTDWLKMEMDGFNYFHPQWLHYKLSTIQEYRVRFADRAYPLLTHDGLFTPPMVNQMIMDRVHEFDTAIIAESARWGDTKVSPSRTKDDDWWPAVNYILTSFIPYRTNIVIDQLSEYDLFSNVDAPILIKSDTTLNGTYYYFSESFNISIENPGSVGLLYYTLDGRDPRSIGGTANDSALSSKDKVNLTISSSTIIMARIKNGIYWSALIEISFLNEVEDYTHLKITELHYHPMDIINGTDTTSGKDFEFIELKNIGSSSINISGIRFDSAVTYTVPPNTILAPNSFFVIASKPEKFYNVYGRYPSGNFKGNLSNGGEYLLLRDVTNTEIFSLIYDDLYPWPYEPDGYGYSLVSNQINPDGNPAYPSYWRASLYGGGSPFADDVAVGIENTVSLSSVLVYPNPTSDFIHVDMNGNLHDGYWELMSQDGRFVNYGAILSDKFTIHLDHMDIQKGLYILKIRSGVHCQVKKVLYMP